MLAGLVQNNKPLAEPAA